MSTTTDKPITVEMGAGYLSATLRISPAAEPREYGLDLCIWELQNAGVSITSAIKQRVKAFVEHRAGNPDDDQPLELQAQPPVNGEDGRIEWDPRCDPNRVESQDEPAEEKVDFYTTHNFIDIEAGQVVARIVPPTEGEYGYDLRGEAIAPRPGQPAPLRFDPNAFTIDRNGECTATLAGVLRVTHRDVTVSPVLQIPKQVDFSTGNIEFNGDVTIGGGVCDCFIVKAKGNIEVGGTIEAATINAGGDLVARSGVATRGAGSIVVGRDLRAKYLNSVTAEARRDVQIEREVIGCQLEVGRNLDVPMGSIIGGKIAVQGSVHAQVIGSDGELATTLSLAFSPKTERMLQTVRQRLKAIDQEKKRATAEAQAIRENKNATHQQREQLTTLMFKPYELDSQAQTLRERLEQLKAMYARMRRVDLTVEKMLYAGVRLIIDGQVYLVRETIKGPVWIGWNKSHKLLGRLGRGAVVALSAMPEIGRES